MSLATIVSGEADLADVWFLVAVIAAGAAAVLAAMGPRGVPETRRTYDLVMILVSVAVAFVALGLLFV
jgi:hypothetical protein